jgi:DNA-directed RNA polymerase subunit beta
LEPAMPDLLANNFRHRRNFAKVHPAIDVLNLISIQRESYEKFLQLEVDASDRETSGLQAVFKSVFPIQDFSHRASLQFVSYDLEEPKYDVDECRERGMTFSAPLKVTVRLVVWDVDAETESRHVSNIKEQEVFFGEIPLMTAHGTFIVNGTERVVVSQLHRSPGIFFSAGKSKSASSNKTIFTARIIPSRGSWIDFEFDTKDILYVRIDRRRKLPATVLLRALGYTTEELLNHFYQREKFIFGEGGWVKETTDDLLKIQTADVDVVGPDGKVIVRAGKKFLRPHIKKLQKAGMLVEETREVGGREEQLLVGRFPVPEGAILGRISAYDVVDMETGEVVVECNSEITEDVIELLLDRGISEVETLYIDNVIVGSFLRDTLLVDKVATMEDAVVEIYRRLRPGDPPTYEAALTHFENLFFNAERYDLSKVGRLKVNHKLGLDVDLDQTTLTREDILRVVQYLIDLKNNRGEVDDIDHLGNRRVRAVGELLETQYRIGLVRMEKAIKERMSLQEIEALMPHDLINAKPVSAVIKEFFGSSQLSQFMDQTNPLSEVTHKRRLSALGPGGLTRERAGFDVRDVHPTHYGRVCPIETPEGPNIGLIASLSTYARVNEYGFIETPYQLVEGSRVSGVVKYMTALEEAPHTVAQANTDRLGDGQIADEYITARKGGEYYLASRDDITLMDVSPNQLVSVAAALVPFLENDDANRALMGSNMQRQAVPVVRTEAPLVGTGMERVVARDSGVTAVVRRAGVVENVDATRIVVKTELEGDDVGNDVDIYNLTKFTRSNQNTCINQKPVVKPGDRVEPGDIIADGPATEMGELALGQNCVVAFMPWQGYNYEDSILVSERLVREDYFTSIHVEEFEVSARDTKLGKEEITRDIPNVGEEAMRNLDEAGIVRVGAYVKSGDILVGKITPKGETQLSPEEKLLRAIFGEKAGDVKDSSLKVPPGVHGVVMGAQVFAREGVEKDSRAMEIERQAIARIERDRDEKVRTIRDSAMRQLVRLLDGRSSGARVVDEVTGDELIARGETFSAANLGRLSFDQLDKITVEDGEEVEEAVWALVDRVREKEDQVCEKFAAKVERQQKGDELSPGVIKMVKVYVAIKRKLQVGDKMAGRHGNKGVISKIMAAEDMPYLTDGTPVDIVLNPLGVPSRMNVGQILETHLGWAARGLGVRIGEMLDEAYGTEALREYLMSAMERQHDVVDFLKGATDAELRRFAEKYRRGVTTATPVFAGAGEDEIKRALKLAGLDEDGRSILFDGRTGEAFANRVTVGVMYVLKLHHLVDEKIHARSIGPYSLVTQQPLGGKAQFGGQRLGEMEVWALEAYGAAYTLQEFLTVKSDDVAGRTRMYESIVKGENVLEAGLPESFNVLVKELQALALDVELIEDKQVLRQP